MTFMLQSMIFSIIALSHKKRSLEKTTKFMNKASNIILMINLNVKSLGQVKSKPQHGQTSPLGQTFSLHLEHGTGKLKSVPQDWQQRSSFPAFLPQWPHRTDIFFLHWRAKVSHRTTVVTARGSNATRNAPPCHSVLYTLHWTGVQDAGWKSYPLPHFTL